MKTWRMACMAGVLCMMTGAAMVAQIRPLPMSDKVNVNLLLSGVRSDGGKLMASAGDPNDRAHMVYAVADPTADGSQTLVVQGVPVGTCDVYVFQDMNGNMTLDRNVEGLPSEPCFMKQKVKLTADGLTVKVKLVNPAEMMGK